ncbi:hypothetical protein M409DRAFT_60539 [Zasmidium cellare ATCC 36951]|uniref:Clr5 domain-containing protein n=1 Tax=Zasmidium cellare ATCC 36951 TaxID=1080233 RepID=A0A6A6BY90_ZASCE|nr:uncharacterized protein M409DRAFT_60539 [Zasmidium cellare ATCC 36951]KAF2159767.1 hypothetical protein M409DRAFT_60539 [Zasmidium cellare ATCC 36951]
MTTRRKPTQAEWDGLQPEIVRQYTTEGRTVRWIVEDLNNRGLAITKKMLWDRFRMWRVPRKYNAKQVGNSRPASALVISPQRAMTTSPERQSFFTAMTNVGDWFRSIVEAETWRPWASERRIDMQRLVSRAHMAIDSESYDTKARLHELHGIEDQSRELVAGTSNAKMHPRVLTALMRLWIADWQTTPWKEQMLKVFQKRWIDRVIDEDADFAVRDQIYGTRVLASIGRPGKAAELLQQTDVRREVTGHTLADFYSTRGYAYLQDKHFQEAIPDLQTAIKTFQGIGEEDSEGAEYAHFCLAMCYEGIGEVGSQEYHLKAALCAWESNAVLQKNQGAIKIVLDLHRVYEEQGKQKEMQQLKERYHSYFEEVPAEPS